VQPNENCVHGFLSAPPYTIGHLNFIMQSSVQFEEVCWVIYDRYFCLKVLEVVISEWSSLCGKFPSLNVPLIRDCGIPTAI